MRKQNFAYFKEFQTVSPANGNTYTIYPDILSEQMFLISQEVKELIEYFESYTKYKEFCLLDYVNKKKAYYYLPILKRYSIDGKIEIVKDNSKALFLNMKLDTTNMSENIFSITKSDKSYTIISLPMAEVLLNL